jgi:hypothetical protein
MTSSEIQYACQLKKRKTGVVDAGGAAFYENGIIDLPDGTDLCHPYRLMRYLWDTTSVYRAD